MVCVFSIMLFYAAVTLTRISFYYGRMVLCKYDRINVDKSRDVDV